MKADIDAAFRRIPSRESHRWAAAVTWSFRGEAWTATHIGMPVGAAASGIAWHKIGHLLQLIGQKLLGLPLFRYVELTSGCLSRRLPMRRLYCFDTRPQTVTHGLSTFVRLVRAVLGPMAVSDGKVEKA